MNEEIREAAIECHEAMQKLRSITPHENQEATDRLISMFSEFKGWIYEMGLDGVN